MNRRKFLAAAACAPAVVKAASEKRSYTYAEIEKILARGDVNGKLTREHIPTPALLLDLDGFEANVARMVKHCKENNRALRPHGKTHKCPQIAKALIQAGAVGACAAKISEAEVFARHGVSGLLITTAVIGKHKIERAVRLAAATRGHYVLRGQCAECARSERRSRRCPYQDSTLPWICLSEAAPASSPATPALGLAQSIDSLPNVKLAGIQAYAGRSLARRRIRSAAQVFTDIMGQAVATRRLFEQKGIACPLLTGGSTGTYNIDSAIDGITELQPGSFMFMDIDYNRIGGQSGPKST